VTIPDGWRDSAGRPGQDAALESNMAKIGKQLQSGKRGPTVSLKTPYGQAERQLAIPANPRTPAQQRARDTLGRIASNWRGLTDEQRAAWTTAAQKTSSQPRLGQSGRLTGCQLFIKINCTLAAAGMDTVVDPPDRPRFTANPMGALAIINTAGDTVLKLKMSHTPAHYTMLLGTAPCSQGISRPRRFALLGALPDPVSGVSDITDLYEAFSEPPMAGRQWGELAELTRWKARFQHLPPVFWSVRTGSARRDGF
jgi:hypothetical protein